MWCAGRLRSAFGDQKQAASAASEHLQEPRMQVIRRAEALPRTWWPRAECERCQGEREVTAVQDRYGTGTAPELVSGRRLCPQCWGTGLTLALPPRG